MAAVRSKADIIGNELLDKIFDEDYSLEKEVIKSVRLKAWRYGLLDAIDIQGDVKDA